MYRVKAICFALSSGPCMPAYRLHTIRRQKHACEQGMCLSTSAVGCYSLGTYDSGGDAQRRTHNVVQLQRQHSALDCFHCALTILLVPIVPTNVLSSLT